MPRSSCLGRGQFHHRGSAAGRWRGLGPGRLSMDCKTGAEHVASLRDGRAVYIDGERVSDVTTHPAFRNAVRSTAALYDFQSRPENLERMTFAPIGAIPEADAVSTAAGRGREIWRSWCNAGRHLLPGQSSRAVLSGARLITSRRACSVR